MPESTHTQSKILLPIAGILVIAVLAFVLMRPSSSDTPAENAQTTESQPAVSEPAEDVQAETSDYKDGVYTVVGNYTSPGGQEEVEVTLTLASDVVVDSDVKVLATRPISKERQEDFAAHYKTQVIGKDISELQLTKVSGSSLTPKGFNDAVEKIKAEAQS